MIDISDIFYTIYSVVYQIVLLDAIFGKPKTKQGIIGQVIYGSTWASAIYMAGHVSWAHRGFIPYLIVFLFFEIIFVVLGCNGSLLCRFVTIMVSWTTFILAKALTAYIPLEGLTVYWVAIAIEIIMAA